MEGEINKTDVAVAETDQIKNVREITQEQQLSFNNLNIVTPFPVHTMLQRQQTITPKKYRHILGMFPSSKKT